MTDRVIADRYRIGDRLGAGAMGQVWLARDELLGRDVAVKQMYVDARNVSDDVVLRARREARLAGRLNHPNAVEVHDFMIVDDTPTLIMEYVPGSTLSHDLKAHGALDVDLVASIFVQVGRALVAAHEQGIVHRDVKPANILITPEGVAKLTDFGIARSGAETTLTATGMMMGTLAYMAPETARGEVGTPASDVWSIGASIYQCVEGRQLFPGTNAADVLLKLVADPVPPPRQSGPLTDLLVATLQRDPADRPTMAEVVELLEALQPEEPEATVERRSAGLGEPLTPALHLEEVANDKPSAPLAPAPPVPATPRRGRRAVALTVAAALIVAASAGTFWMWPHSPSEEATRITAVDNSLPRPAVVARPLPDAVEFTVSAPELGDGVAVERLDGDRWVASEAVAVEKRADGGELCGEFRLTREGEQLAGPSTRACAVVA